MAAPFSVHSRPDFTVVEFQTASLMNAAELDRVRKALNALVDNDQSARILLDFTPVKFLSSQAIGLFVELYKKTSIGGGKLVLCSLTPQLLQLLKVTRMDQVFVVVKDQKEASKATG